MWRNKKIFDILNQAASVSLAGAPIANQIPPRGPMIARWFLTIALLVSPTLAQAQATIPSLRADDVVRVPTAGQLANTTARDRRRITGLVLGVAALAGATTGWSLVVWSSRGPTPDLIASADAPDLTQARYDALEARWRHTRVALHATGAASAVLANLALTLYGDRLRRWPTWCHWTLGALGLGLATYGAIDISRTPECKGNDPRFCADNTYRLDRGAMMLYTAIPLVSEPLIGRAWRPRISIEPSRGEAAMLLTWPL